MSGRVIENQAGDAPFELGQIGRGAALAARAGPVSFRRFVSFLREVR